MFGNFWTAFLLLTGAYPVIIGYISDTAGIQQSFALLGIGTLVAIIPMLVLQRTDVVSLRR